MSKFCDSDIPSFPLECKPSITSLKSLRLRDLLTFGYLWLPILIFGFTFPCLKEPYWALLGLTGLYFALLNLTGSDWSLLGHTEHYWALLGLTGPYWPLLGLTGPYWALLGALLHLMTD